MTDRTKPAGRAARFGWWALSYGPSIITMAGGAALAFSAAVWELADHTLLQGMLVLLILIATSLLTERFIGARESGQRLAAMGAEVKSLAKAVERHGQGLDSLVIRRKDLTPLEDRLKGASRVSISGGSLVRLASEYKHTFEGLVAQGCHIRLLMVDPNHVATEQLHNSVVYEVIDVDEYRRQVRAAISGLGGLASTSGGKLDIRVSSFVPTYSIVAIDRHDGSGTLQVELYPFKLPARDRPTLIIHKERDPRLHEFFSKQFDEMWGSDLTNLFIDQRAR